MSPLEAEAAREPPLLQQRPFRMLSFTRFSSRLAQNAINFALLLLIVDETGKAFLSSLLVLALVVPATVAGIVSGAAADVFPKRLLIFTGDLLRAAICILFVLGPGNVASYYIVAVALASVAQIATSAEGAVLPCIVERRQLARANAIGHAVGGAAQLGGFVILTPIALRLFKNEDVLFIVCAGLFAFAAVQAVFIGRVRSPRATEVGSADPEGPWWKAGWSAMRSNPRVMSAAVELTLISTSLIILGGLIPTYITEVLDLPVDVGAVVLTPAAIGVVLGLRIAGFLAHRVPHGLLSTTGFVSFVVLLALVAFVNQEADFLAGYGAFAWLDDVSIGRFDGGGVLAAALMLPTGFAFALVSVAAQTVLNDLVPLNLQGRVLATQSALAGLASSIPVLLAGVLADLTGVVPVMALLSAATGIAAVANIRSGRRASRQGLPASAGIH